LRAVSTTRFIPAPDQGDAQVVVLAVELFEGATVVVLATTIWEELAAARFFEHEEAALVIEDDLGTEYRRGFQVGSSIAGMSGGGRTPTASIASTWSSSRPSPERRPTCGSRSVGGAAWW
jgi:hypothetical protein